MSENRCRLQGFQGASLCVNGCQQAGKCLRAGVKPATTLDEVLALRSENEKLRKQLEKATAKPEQSESDILELLAEYRHKYADLDPQACMVFGTAEMHIKRLSCEARPSAPFREALMDLYTAMQGSNDFRPDSRVARKARQVLAYSDDLVKP